MVIKGQQGQHSSFHQVSNYQFAEFGKKEKTADTSAKAQESVSPSSPYQTNIQKFVTPELESYSSKDQSTFDATIKQERTWASKSHFTISPVVKKYRGMQEQEENEYEAKIQKAINERLQAVEKEWQEKGYEEGMILGLAEAKAEFKTEVESYLLQLQQMITEVVNTKEDILRSQKNQTIELLKQLTKWIILRELQDDDHYLQRLLEKLILELGTKEHLLIKVNKSALQHMPQVIEIVEQRLGELRNIRVEADYDQDLPGMVVESLNGIMDGSFESQMESLHKLFDLSKEIEKEKAS